MSETNHKRYTASILFHEAEYDTVQEVIDAMLERGGYNSGQGHPCLKPMWIELGSTTQIVDKAGKVYHTEVRKEIDLPAMEQELACGKRVRVAMCGIMEDGSPLFGAGSADIYLHAVYETKKRESLAAVQKYADKTGESFRCGNQVIAPQSHRAKRKGK